MNNPITQEVIDKEYALLQEFASKLAYPEYAMNYYDKELEAYDKKDYANLEGKLRIIRSMRADQYGLRN